MLKKIISGCQTGADIAAIDYIDVRFQLPLGHAKGRLVGDVADRAADGARTEQRALDGLLVQHQIRTRDVHRQCSGIGQAGDHDGSALADRRGSSGDDVLVHGAHEDECSIGALPPRQFVQLHRGALGIGKSMRSTEL